MAAAVGSGAVAATAGAAAAGSAPAGRLPIMVIFSWAQCDKCSKWRRLPPGHEPSEDAFWECSMSPTGSFNTCEAAEEEMPENELAGEKLDAVTQQRKQHCRLRHNRCQNKWRQRQTLSGVKSYACKHEGCGKCFTLLDNLKRHEKSHPAKARREVQQNPRSSAHGTPEPPLSELTRVLTPERLRTLSHGCFREAEQPATPCQGCRFRAGEPRGLARSLLPKKDKGSLHPRKRLLTSRPPGQCALIRISGGARCVRVSF